MSENPRIVPLGEGAVTVDFGNEISVPLNERVIALALKLESDPFPGMIEAVPAYASVSIFFDLVEVCRSFPKSSSAYAAVSDLVGSAIQDLPVADGNETPPIEIPVDFGDTSALDLTTISQHSGLSRENVIDIFVSRTYRVFMIGFLPGFAYMGEVDERIAVPRHSSPRLRVPKGSVGIAGRQTGIYPLESPGGWQIIGRTHVEMFTGDETGPCRLHAGDIVRFRSQ